MVELQPFGFGQTIEVRASFRLITYDCQLVATVSDFLTVGSSAMVELQPFGFGQTIEVRASFRLITYDLPSGCAGEEPTYDLPRGVCRRKAHGQKGTDRGYEPSG